MPTKTGRWGVLARLWLAIGSLSPGNHIKRTQLMVEAKKARRRIINQAKTRVNDAFLIGQCLGAWDGSQLASAGISWHVAVWWRSDSNVAKIWSQKMDQGLQRPETKILFVSGFYHWQRSCVHDSWSRWRLDPKNIKWPNKACLALSKSL